MEASDTGLELRIDVPVHLAVTGTSIALWRRLPEEEELSEHQVFTLTAVAAQHLASGEPLRLVDDIQSDASYAVSAGEARPECLAQSRVEVSIPPPPERPPAPVVSALGLVVRIDAPKEASNPARLIRRSLREEDGGRLVLVAFWDTSEPFIDVEVEQGGIYAYSVVNVSRSDALGDALSASAGTHLERIGKAGPESYAAVGFPESDLSP